jgi:hypothetical protein
MSEMSVCANAGTSGSAALTCVNAQDGELCRLHNSADERACPVSR